MKILYLGNFNSPNAEYISKTLEEFGHEVTRKHEDNITVDQLLEAIKGKELLFTEEARLRKDYIYGNYRKGEKDHCLGGMEKVMKEIKTIPWLTNVFWAIDERVHLIQENPIFRADTVFTTDGGRDKEWKEAVINHVCVRQGIFKPEAYIAEVGNVKKKRVGFVGENNQRFWPYREELLLFLTRTFGARFKWVGGGSGNGVFYGRNLNEVIATIEIMVGDSVYSPYYWSNRVYEMIGRGAFLIMPDIPGLKDEFPDMITYEFGNFKDLEEKIIYYVENPKEREKIKLKNFSLCSTEYTYDKRLKCILNTNQKTM